MRITKLSITLALFAVTGCSKSEPGKTDTTAAMAPGAMAPATTSAAGSGMAMGNAHSDSLAAHAQSQLDALKGASPDAAVKMVPEYKESITALLADCERMMTQMKMTPPAKWNTASGAVRADLVTMSSANANALHAMMPRHAERVKAILDMRHAMMKM